MQSGGGVKKKRAGQNVATSACLLYACILGTEAEIYDGGISLFVFKFKKFISELPVSLNRRSNFMALQGAFFWPGKETGV